jgi:hypothetical protein
MMKSLSWWLGFAAMCAAVTVFGRATPVLAAEPERGGPVERLERLERRVNEMAERQEQLMRRLGAQQQERQRPMAAPIRERIRRQMALPGGGGIGRPTPPAGAPELVGAPVPAGPPAAAAKHLKEIADVVKLCFMVALIFNILIAVWIFTDIRKRGEGSGIFVVLALLAGVPAAIIYAIVRIGDRKT